MSRHRSVDLNLLRTLDALYQTGKVSAAAELLGVSQPAVSQGLKHLREYFQDPLFVRARYGMSLTPHALAMKAPLQRLLRELESQVLTPAIFDPRLAERTFTLCLSDLAEFQWLGAFLMRFRQAAPNCRLRSMRVPVGEISALLEAGKADLAFGGLLPEMPPALRQRRMFDYNYACLLARDHPARTAFDRETFMALPHIIVSRSGDFEDYLDKALRRLGIMRKAVISLSDNIVAAKLVSETDMVVTVPARVARQLANVFPLEIVDLPVRVPQVVSRMYWHERFNTDPANQWLRHLARAVVGEDGG